MARMNHGEAGGRGEPGRPGTSGHGGAGGAGGRGGAGQQVGGAGGAGGAGGPGSPFKKFLRRPVPWAAVIGGYVGLFLGGAYERWDATKERDNIVTTSQQTLRNSCEFDNARATELKLNLQLFLDDHISLHEHVGLPIHHGSNIDAIQASIDSLTVRNCAAEVRTLNDEGD